MNDARPTLDTFREEQRVASPMSERQGVLRSGDMSLPSNSVSLAMHKFKQDASNLSLVVVDAEGIVGEEGTEGRGDVRPGMRRSVSCR